MKKSHVMIVVSPYYEDVAEHLLNGVIDTLEKQGGITYEVFEVTGALEIPLAVKLGINRHNKKFNAYIALGCVIRGETSHYDVVCNESAGGLMRLSLEYNAPIGNGIITCDTMEQALRRADPNQKNKGADVANAVIGLMKLKQKLKINQI